jgi:phosphatidyl-myo-inositol alpha-mannosyltransferase
MRIAIVSPYDLAVPGGVQSHVRLLAAALRRAGDRVVVVGAGTPGVHRAEAEVTVGSSHGVAFNGSVAPIALGPAAALRTRTVLADLAPDVVHVHEPLVPAVGLAAATHPGPPRVLTFHAWSDRSRAYRAARPLARRVLDAAEMAIAVSPAAAAYHAGALGVDAGRFRLVPNGVDVAPFAAAADRLGGRRPDGPPRLVFVGRLEPRKGVLVLARAYRELLATRPEARLLIIGDGPERGELEALVADLPAGQVELAGRVTGPALAASLAAADVAVAPALGGESFGIVLLEAMAARTTVVASDIPGYRSVITDGSNGVLVPSGEPAVLATAIADVLADDDRRRALVEEGSRTALAHDWPEVAARVRAVYAEAVDRAG